MVLRIMHGTPHIVLVMSICMIGAISASATTYYVDAQGGDDANSGLLTSAAWKTVGKVNGFAFSDGDTVLFRRGGVWNDATLSPYQLPNDFTIADYGTGEKPWFNGNVRKPVSISPSSKKRNLTIRNIDISGQGWSPSKDYNLYINNIENVLVEGVYGDGHRGWNGTGEPKSGMLPWTEVSGTIEIRSCELTNWGYPTIGSASGGQDYMGIVIFGRSQSAEIRIHDNVIHHIESDGVHIYRSTTPVYVYDNQIYDCGEECVDVKAGSNVELSGNRFYRTSEFTEAGGSGGGEVLDLVTIGEYQTVEPYYRADNCIVRNNYFGGGNVAGLTTEKAVRNLRVYDNRFENHQWPAIYLKFSCEEVSLYNNVITNDTIYVESTGAGTTIHDNTIYNGNIDIRQCVAPQVRNNLVVANDGSVYPFVYLGEGSDAPSVNHNLWYNTASERRVNWQGTAYTVSQFDSWLSNHAGAIFGTPLLVDASNGDFHLQAGSAARDAGVDLGLASDFEGTPEPQGPAPDIGAFEYAGALTTYSLTVTAADGTVAKSPDKAEYSAGEAVTVQAVANSGYSFAGWSGDLTGDTNPTTVTMNTDKSITATFSAIPATTYTLNVSAANGSVTKSPNKTSYDAGETVTVQAVANSGYSFIGWSGDLSGSANPTSITMDADKSITATFSAIAPTTYTLNVSAANGSVTKSPNKTSYDAGESVTIQAVANSGYSFAGWSGDLTGSVNPTSVTMDANKSITATFAAIVPTTYTLSVAATHGSVTASPSKVAYEEGEAVTVQAVPDGGYVFAGWSGDLSGNTNPTTVTMNANKSVTATFTATYTLTVGAAHGSVAKMPNKTFYDAGEAVTLEVTADDGYDFTGWSGDLSGSANPVTVTMNANKSITAGFRETSADDTPPVVVPIKPEADAFQVALNSLVKLEVLDDGDGVDANTVTISLNGVTVYTGNTSRYRSSLGVCRRSETEDGFTYVFQSDGKFDADDTVTLTVNAADQNGNVMDEYAYSFTTEMLAFGVGRRISVSLDDRKIVNTRSVSRDPQDAEPAGLATVRDSQGNVWIAWDAGPVGQRDIYLSMLGFENDTSVGPISLTTNAADQCYPDIAIGDDDRLYVVWQDNRQGNWDIYVRTSADGENWSAEAQIGDSDDDQTVPVVAVGPAGCYVAWEDDRDGNQDICVGSSSDGFASAAISRVTTDASDQTNPAIAADASGGVYIVWTDGRNGTADIYGAASNSDSWVNVPVVSGAGNQYAPALAAEDQGSLLHLAWVSDAAGDSDIYYAATAGMPSGPLVGTDLVDDTSGAEQQAPSITTWKSADNDLSVFVCWEDWRNLTASGDDTDLYFVEVGEGTRTNVLAGDDGTASDQRAPAIGVNLYGYPYMVWKDNRNGDTEIYYSGTTFWDPDVLASGTVTASEGGTVGVAAPASIGDVSVTIPAEAMSQDVTVSITKTWNPQLVSAPGALCYELGPTGLEFSEPATITIPYVVADFGRNAPYARWYDARTGSLSQEGITDVENLTLTSTLHAVRFKATHFTPYYLISYDEMREVVTTSGAEAAGCALVSPDTHTSAIEYFIPYALLGLVMAGLRWKDARRRRRLS